MAPDLDPVQGMSRVISEPFNLDPQRLRLRTHTWFVTLLSCDLEPDITKPTYRKIFISDDLDPDLSDSRDSIQVISWVLREPFLLNSSCYNFEKVNKGRKIPTVDTYGGRSKLYITQIRIKIIFCFTEKSCGTKPDQSDVATHGGRIHVYIFSGALIFG